MLKKQVILSAVLLGLLLVCQVPAMADGNYTYVDSFSGVGVGDGFDRPYGVAVDSRDGFGHVYVVDTYKHRIARFDKYGNFVPGNIWGGVRGSAVGQFDHPEGIAVDVNGIVYVADTMNNRIQQLDNVGQWAEIIADLQRPSSVAVDNDRIYVSDTGNASINVYNKHTFDRVSTWGAGLLDQPRGVAVDGSGNLYVMDGGHNRIRVFNSAGSEIRNWSASGYGISLNGSEQLFRASPTAHKIRVSDNTGGQEDAFGSMGSEDLQFQQPRDVAVARVSGQTNYIYVADTGNNRISIWAPKGSTLPPVAKFNYIVIEMTNSAPLSVQFKYTEQSDPGRAPETFTWAFGDGGTSSAQDPLHVYQDPGVYTVTLTVRNNEGVDVSPGDVIITVTEPPLVYFTRQGEMEHLERIDMTPGQIEVLSLWLDVPVPAPEPRRNDLSGFNLTVKLDNELRHPVSIIDVVHSPAWVPFEFRAIPFDPQSYFPAVSLWCRAADLSGESGADRIHLFDVSIMGYQSTYDESTLYLERTPTPDGGEEIHIADREGDIYRPRVLNTIIHVKGVHPFPRPSGGFFIHPDPSKNPLWEIEITGEPERREVFVDLDQNGRVGFNDVVIFWNNMPAIERGDHGAKKYFDYDNNDVVTYSDLIRLYDWIDVVEDVRDS